MIGSSMVKVMELKLWTQVHPVNQAPSCQTNDNSMMARYTNDQEGLP